MEKKATATTLMVVVFFLAIFSLPAPAKAGIGEEIAGLFLGLAVDAIGTAVQAGAERSIIEAETRRLEEERRLLELQVQQQYTPCQPEPQPEPPRIYTVPPPKNVPLPQTFDRPSGSGLPPGFVQYNRR